MQLQYTLVRLIALLSYELMCAGLARQRTSRQRTFAAMRAKQQTAFAVVVAYVKKETCTLTCCLAKVYSIDFCFTLLCKPFGNLS